MLHPCVDFIILQAIEVGLKCQGMRSENVVRCQISESILPVSKWAEFYAGTMRLKHTREHKFTCSQNNVIHSFSAIGDKTLYQKLPPTHKHRHAYVGQSA